jgi:zinc protease
MKAHTRLAVLVSWALLLIAPSVFAQAAAVAPESPLPIDPQVHIGTLENGLGYYIRANERPENRAELRLVVNAGSILEEEDQRGLAHFVEHMAFTGTKNFERQELVGYLESIGMRFGPDVNAYTSFDETVYMLTIPLDDREVVTTAFRILAEWATNIVFNPAEVDRERGVVVEEWRSGRGAQARLLDGQIPVVLQGSRYAERLPIGLPEVLRTAPPAALNRFYERWYRPDLMAVVAVGDFDPADVESLIREHFAHLSARASGADRPTYDVPGHARTLFHIATDAEMPVTRIEILHKQPSSPRTTVHEYRQSLVERAFNGMLNERFSEITQKPDAPFVQAFSGRGGFVRTADAFTLGAVVADGGVERGLEALLVEAERVARHGFTAGELDRYKLNLLRSFERAHAERARTNSALYANAYIGHFLRGTPIPGIEFEYQLAQQMVPGIELEEVDRLAREWMTEASRVVLVSGPEKEGAALPDEAALRAVIAAAATAEVSPYEDTASDEPLLARTPSPGEIVSEHHHESVDVVEWRLANGVRVLLKSTDFRDDEIVMRAYSPGGTSLAPDTLALSAGFAVPAVQSSGLGAFSAVELQRALAGKSVRISTFIGALEQGFNGNTSSADMETLFQLVHLYFTAPREDADAVAALVERQRAFLANRSVDPVAAFNDTLQVALTQHHPRSRPMTAARLDELDVAYAHAFYRDRFADASDFTFVFVGNLDIEALRPLVQRYLATLPSTGRADSWRDDGVRPPDGVVERVVRQGVEPRAITQIVFHGPVEYGLDTSHLMSSLAGVIRIRLREVLREDLGGTYGVQVTGTTRQHPDERYTLSISFGADPERLDELVAAARHEIERIRTDGPRAQDIQRVRETQRRERETNLRQNGYWLAQLAAYDRGGHDFAEILGYEARIEALTADMVRDAARAWLNFDRYVRVSLFPAEVVED